MYGHLAVLGNVFISYGTYNTFFRSIKNELGVTRVSPARSQPTERTLAL